MKNSMLPVGMKIVQMGQILLLHDQIACKCDAIWPDLETSEWNYAWLWSKFYWCIRISSIWMDMIGEGYVAFIQTLLMRQFRYWCQKFILWWPSTVCGGIFCCWWWVCADDERSVPPEEGIHQVTGPKGLGGRSCHSTPWTIILPPSPKFTKGSSGNCHQMGLLYICELSGQVQVFLFHAYYMWVWQWFVWAVSTDVDTGSIQSRISNRSNLNNRLTTLDALLLLIT